MSQCMALNVRRRTSASRRLQSNFPEFPGAPQSAVIRFTHSANAALASQVHLLHTDKASAQVDGHREINPTVGSGRVFGATP
jgi:hypothetical protein